MKKVGCHTYRSEKKSGEYPEKNLGRCYHKKVRWHPINWVDFTGYPTNHFSGCKITGE